MSSWIEREACAASLGADVIFMLLCRPMYKMTKTTTPLSSLAMLQMRCASKLHKIWILGPSTCIHKVCSDVFWCSCLRQWAHANALAFGQATRTDRCCLCYHRPFWQVVLSEWTLEQTILAVKEIDFSPMEFHIFMHGVRFKCCRGHHTNQRRPRDPANCPRLHCIPQLFARQCCWQERCSVCQDGGVGTPRRCLCYADS
jgi:hypothetical protein